MWERRATIDLEPWRYEDRPRVLIEHPEPDDALELAAAIRAAGCTVGICGGPNATGRCPLHALEPCVAVGGADLVVTALAFDDADGRAVLRGLRRRYADVPLVVLATVSDTLALGDVLYGCTVLPVDSPPERVAEEVRAQLGSQYSVVASRRR